MFFVLQIEDENGVIYTWKDEMISYDLKRLLRKLVKDCRPGVRIVVLYGIHGSADGTLGKQDDKLIRCFKLAIEQVQQEKNTQKFIDEKNISIEGVILDTLSGTLINNHDELIGAISGANILILSYCFTNVNVMNDILRSKGLYAEIILRGESSSILEKGKLIELDPVQKKILEEFMSQHPQLIFLIGHYGTGKTLILVLMLAIRIGELVQQGEKRIKIIITADVSKNSILLQDLEKKHFQFIKNINATKKEDDQIELIVEPLQALIERHNINIMPNRTTDFVVHKNLLSQQLLDSYGWIKGVDIKEVLSDFCTDEESCPPDTKKFLEELKKQSNYQGIPSA